MEPTVNIADCHCTISEVIVRIVLYWCAVWLCVLCMCVRKVCMYVHTVKVVVQCLSLRSWAQYILCSLLGPKDNIRDAFVIFFRH